MALCGSETLRESYSALMELRAAALRLCVKSILRYRTTTLKTIAILTQIRFEKTSFKNSGSIQR